MLPTSPLPDDDSAPDNAAEALRQRSAQASTKASTSAASREETLDARGLVCPLPVLKARKRLQSLPSGSILRVLSDDAGSLADFRHFCAEQQHTLLGQDKDEGCAMTIVHRLRKG